MKVVTKEDSKIIVTVKTASRDKEGRMVYETFESLDVQDATPQEVFNACVAGIKAASTKK